MNTTPPDPVPDNEFRDDLLCDRAVFGLDSEDSTELARTLPPGVDDESYELAAAALLVSDETLAEQPLPAGLRDRVLATAKQFEFQAVASPQRVAPSQRPTPTRRDGLLFALFAVAASIAVAVWLGGPPSDPATRLAEARAALLLEAPNPVRLDWTPTEDLAAVGPDEGDREAFDWGDVVWSDELQSGFLRFRGLAANDPTAEQYQLWIFDADRDDRHPVDGGVFDVTAEGETIVPIDAKLLVSKAVMFAVTVEKPGGVVVSDRSRLPLLAKL